MPETELYEPVKKLLEEEGYNVKGEVGDCDVYAVSPDGKTLAAELKLRLNLDVLVQAAQRQKLADSVYIAVPSPKRSSLKRWQNICHLLRRLEIGLITVKPEGAKITFEAKAFDRAAAYRRSKKTREKIEEEFSLRHGDLNVGGTKGKTVTLYRERAVLLAALSDKYGRIRILDAPYMTGNPKASSIIKNNYYGWFENDKKHFWLTDKGKEELLSYSELAKQLLKEAEG